MSLFTQASAEFKNIDADELIKVIDSQGSNVELIDVRTEEEHHSGHIPNSKNLNVMGPTFSDQIDGLDKNKSYFVYCASGNRSKAACSLMLSRGFSDVTNLELGMMGWTGEIE